MITELRHKYPLKELLLFAGVARSTYYYYLIRMQKPDKYKVEKEEITAIYHENQGRYGYRRITLEMRNRGYVINHKTVTRLMKELGLKCMVRIKKYRSYKGEIGKVAPDLIKRDFKADAPNRKWTTDITEFSLFGRKMYLSPVLDMYNGEIISYNISDRPLLNQVMDMLDKAFLKIPDDTNLIFHSDQGWQYQHKQYQYIFTECKKYCFQSFHSAFEMSGSMSYIAYVRLYPVKYIPIMFKHSDNLIR